MRQVGERLARRGHSVTVATSFLKERELRELNGVQIKEFKVAGNLVNGIMGEVKAYQDYVIKGDFDVLLIKAAQQWALDALIPVLGRISKPKILIPCGFSALYDPAYSDYFRKMPEILRQFDQLIFYATDYRDTNFARHHGLTKLAIVPNGASEAEFCEAPDPGFRQRHGIPEDAFVLLTVGSLTGLKGHREVAEAFALASFKDRPAVLILNGGRIKGGTWCQRLARLPRQFLRLRQANGSRHAIKWLFKLILNRAVPGRLVSLFAHSAEPALDTLFAQLNGDSPMKRAMLVNLPRSELIQAYLNSDLFVFASNVEYSPLVLYEAAAAGLPFLTVPVGNAEEIAKWTGGGVVCPAAIDRMGYTRVNSIVFAEEITRLAANQDSLAHMGEIGRRNWEERFTWDKITLLYEKVLDQCAQKV